MATNLLVERDKAVDIARSVGGMILRERGKDTEFSMQGEEIKIGLDTRADVMGREMLNRYFPTDGQLTEENLEMPILASGRVWVADFLDGTGNFFKRKLKDWSVLVGLVENGEPELGVAYLPDYGQMFTARQGQGAYKNNEPVTVSKIGDLSEAVVCLDPGYDTQAIGDIDYFQAMLEPLVKRVVRLNANGYALCLMAEGKLDGLIHFSSKNWEIAAMCIAAEAGAKITDFARRPIKYNLGTRDGFEFVAASPEIQQELQQTIVKIKDKLG